MGRRDPVWPRRGQLCESDLHGGGVGPVGLPPASQQRAARADLRRVCEGVTGACEGASRRLWVLGSSAQPVVASSECCRCHNSAVR